MSSPRENLLPGSGQPVGGVWTPPHIGIPAHIAACPVGAFDYARSGLVRLTATTELDVAALKVLQPRCRVVVVLQHDYDQLFDDALLTWRLKKNQQRIDVPLISTVHGEPFPVYLALEANDEVEITAQLSNASLVTNTPVFVKAEIYATDDIGWIPPVRPTHSSLPGRPKTEAVAVALTTPTQFKTTPFYIATGQGYGLRVRPVGGAVRIYGYQVSGTPQADTNGWSVYDGQESSFRVADLRRIAYGLLSGSPPCTLQFTYHYWRDIG